MNFHAQNLFLNLNGYYGLNFSARCQLIRNDTQCDPCLTLNLSDLK